MWWWGGGAGSGKILLSEYGLASTSQGFVAEEGVGGSVYFSEDLVLSERFSLVGVK